MPRAAGRPGTRSPGAVDTPWGISVETIAVEWGTRGPRAASLGSMTEATRPRDEGSGTGAPIEGASASEVAHVRPEVEGAVRSVLARLILTPGVGRVAVALAEGGGRRLVFASSLTLEQPVLSWCHLDAFDALPLPAVAASGRPVVGRLDELDPRFDGFVQTQREAGFAALVGVPVPGVPRARGGILLYLTDDQALLPCRRVASTAAVSLGHFLAGLTASVPVADDAITTTAPAEALGGAAAVAVRALVADLDADLVAHGMRSAALVLPADVRASGQARRFLAHVLAEWRVPDETVQTALLLQSELVTNAVVHAESSSELRVQLSEGRLRVQVRDGGGGAQPPVVADAPAADPLRVHGRGLLLVDALSSEWGAEQDATGATAWFVLDVPRL